MRLLLIMCYSFGFLLLPYKTEKNAAKVFNFKCRTGQKVIMHELSISFFRIFPFFLGKSYVLQFQFFMSKYFAYTPDLHAGVFYQFFGIINSAGQNCI